MLSDYLAALGVAVLPSLSVLGQVKQLWPTPPATCQRPDCPQNIGCLGWASAAYVGYGQRFLIFDGSRQFFVTDGWMILSRKCKFLAQITAAAMFAGRL